VRRSETLREKVRRAKGAAMRTLKSIFSKRGKDLPLKTGVKAGIKPGYPNGLHPPGQNPSDHKPSDWPRGNN
jgi:hypothetical protein